MRDGQLHSSFLSLMKKKNETSVIGVIRVIGSGESFDRFLCREKHKVLASLFFSSLQHGMDVTRQRGKAPDDTKTKPHVRNHYSRTYAILS